MNFTPPSLYLHGNYEGPCLLSQILPQSSLSATIPKKPVHMHIANWGKRQNWNLPKPAANQSDLQVVPFFEPTHASPKCYIGTFKFLALTDKGLRASYLAAV